jgi:tetratricopeptide (TPR) repeat protein
MRGGLILTAALVALSAQGITPEVGKEKLRSLVRLPSISFQAQWTFDPEQGFAIGTGAVDTLARIAELRGGLQQDNGDAEIHLALAELYAGLGDNRNARLSWQRAQNLFRKRLEQQPDNGPLLTGLGRSLAGVGRDDEAESVLRRAVVHGSTDWRCQVALGRFLDSLARRAILNRPIPAASASDAGNPPAIPDRPSAAEVALAQKQLVEAGECFERAVDFAPKESEAYYRRGMHRCLRQVLLNQIGVAGAADGELSDAYEDCFTPEILADLQRASQLSPNDYRLIGGTVLFEIYTVSTRSRQAQITTWSSLPDKSQQSVRESIARLEELAQDSQPRKAAGALEVLGILQGPVLHEPTRCVNNLRRALALQPTRDQAWEVLLSTLSEAGRYDELLDVCEDQVRLKETPRTHVLLAKAHEKLKQWDSCEEQAQLAALQDPNDFNATFTLGALLLKRSRGNAEVLTQANQWLARSEATLNKTPRIRRTRDQVIELTLTRSIYFALTDEMDTARQWAKAVLDRDQDNQLAKDILSAMDF